MKRFSSIDYSRGLVMMIMALDHVRDLIHVDAGTFSPTDLNRTYPLLFFTRWITYLCAPVFVFLAGTSAFLSFQRSNNVSAKRWQLFKRGIWLVVVEFSIINLTLFFDTDFHSLLFEVIASIGMGFILLSFLNRMPYQLIVLTGLLIIFLHGLIPVFNAGPGHPVETALNLLFNMGVYPIAAHRVFIMAYPPIPWLGILLLGYGAGKLFELPAVYRKRLLNQFGTGSILLFIMLRSFNLYGESSPWTVQKDGLFSFLSYLNLNKYPPSLLFSLLMLGVLFLILAYAEDLQNRFADIATVFGKVPLFYFIVHFFLIHCILIIVLQWQGFHWSQLEFASGSFGRPKGAISGLPLWLVYLIWIAVVVSMYQPCKWYGKYKAEHDHWWLKYL